MCISDWSSDVCSSDLQECLGGAGYIEESILPRLYRQAPLNSIWEGSGNIQRLVVLREVAREPASGAALLAQLDVAAGMASGDDQWPAGLKTAAACGTTQDAGATSPAARSAAALAAA